jgi:hypothetical protein
LRSTTPIEKTDTGIGSINVIHDFITLGGKFPRLTKKDAKARLKEIKKLLLAL